MQWANPGVDADRLQVGQELTLPALSDTDTESFTLELGWERHTAPLGTEAPVATVRYVGEGMASTARTVLWLLAVGLGWWVGREPRGSTTWAAVGVGAIGAGVVGHFLLGTYGRVVWGADIGMAAALLPLLWARRLHVLGLRDLRGRRWGELQSDVRSQTRVGDGSWMADSPQLAVQGTPPSTVATPESGTSRSYARLWVDGGAPIAVRVRHTAPVDEDLLDGNLVDADERENPTGTAGERVEVKLHDDLLAPFL